MRVADYKELRGYNLAFDSAMEIFELSRSWPSEEKDSHHDHICRQLTKMMDDAASWCGTGGAVREVPAEYVVVASERDERESVRKTHLRSNAPDAPDAPRS
jgi:hypothetical protein